MLLNYLLHQSYSCLALISFIILCSCTESSRPEKTQLTVMDTDKALLLTKAWCDEAHESFSKVNIAANGDFGGVLGAPEVVYSTQDKRLTILGLVINDATVMAKRQELFKNYEIISRYEPYTLGEGYFYIERNPKGEKEPQLTLRKDFTNGSISPKQFVKEVRWLMSWSTYWRMERSREVLLGHIEELIKQSPAIEAEARKNQPRPW